MASTSACSDEPVEYFTPPPVTDTPTKSVEPVEDEPEVFERPDLRMIATPVQPATANELSEDGARAFAYYFLEVLNYTAATGKTELLESISGPECNYCQRFSTSIAEREESGRWTVGYEATFVSEPELVLDSGVAFGFSVQIHTTQHEIFSAEGQHSVEPEEDLNDGALVVYRLDRSWLVEAVGARAGE